MSNGAMSITSIDDIQWFYCELKKEDMNPVKFYVLTLLKLELIDDTVEALR